MATVNFKQKLGKPENITSTENFIAGQNIFYKLRQISDFSNSERSNN